MKLETLQSASTKSLPLALPAFQNSPMSFLIEVKEFHVSIRFKTPVSLTFSSVDTYGLTSSYVHTYMILIRYYLCLLHLCMLLPLFACWMTWKPYNCKTSQKIWQYKVLSWNPTSFPKLEARQRHLCGKCDCRSVWEALCKTPPAARLVTWAARGESQPDDWGRGAACEKAWKHIGLKGKGLKVSTV